MGTPGTNAFAERAAGARAAMVDELAASGSVTSSDVLAAMRRVPREAFVPRFWSLAPGTRRGEPAVLREWHLEDDEEGVLELVYDPQRPLAIQREPGADGAPAGAGITSAASAPVLVASMLELLEVQPGARVLEIGTGSGYNAALLRELVGPEGAVVSVDIDAGLVQAAGEHLRAAGYGDVALHTGDGYLGVAERAPFDRVVATVGCLDLAPAWLDQLAPSGCCLLPLEHGGGHPLTRIEPLDEGAGGTLVGFSGFVGIQGHQASASSRERPERPGPMPDLEWADLDADLAALLQPSGTGAPPAERPAWGLALVLALEDARCGFGLGLVDDGSSAVLDAERGRIGWAGPGGAGLRGRLLEVVARWRALGRPSLADFACTFTPRATSPARAPARPAPGERWVIERVDYRQELHLRRRRPPGAQGRSSTSVT